MEDLVQGAGKKHRKSKTGAKATKKDVNRKKKLGLSTERYNPKAFSVANVVRTKRTQQRNLDRQQKKEVVPLVNRAIDELPPPILIVIMGPKGCGKSTLIRSLVKIFSGQNITDTNGPITCVTGRKRRVTLFECPLDMYSSKYPSLSHIDYLIYICTYIVDYLYTTCICIHFIHIPIPYTHTLSHTHYIHCTLHIIQLPHSTSSPLYILYIYTVTDLSKVADLVLLMIDASYGFEMETFEYLNMLQLHGFPKVLGVLTHLDKFKMNKTLQTTKKILKNRFWTEIYKGAKMFDLSGQYKYVVIIRV